MPSKKQRRRAEKARRHEYEYVLLDEDGNEVPVEGPSVQTKKKEQERAPKARAGGRGGRPAREVPPPSWQRVAKRGLMFAPVMFLMVTLIDPKVSTAGKVTNTLMLLAFFLPFSYLMDTFAYRTYRKRIDRGTPS